MGFPGGTMFFIVDELINSGSEGFGMVGADGIVVVLAITVEGSIEVENLASEAGDLL